MPSPRRVAFVTDRRHAGLTHDDHLAVAPLAARGLQVVPAVWDDPAVRWDDFAAIVLRSPWDYFEHADRFAAWIAGLHAVAARGVRVCNAPALLEWNLDKRYLRELAARGIRVPDTLWLDAGTPASEARLGALMDAHGWDACVVKPVVSAGAYFTTLVARPDADAEQPALDALRARQPVMVQRFLPVVTEEGEWSLLFFGGRFSHAVRKLPTRGDFRVQEQYGGTATLETPAPWVLHEARAVLAALPPHVAATPPLYARVDGVVQADGHFLLMELEALEPSLFLRCDREAPGRFAAAVEEALG